MFILNLFFSEFNWYLPQSNDSIILDTWLRLIEVPELKLIECGLFGFSLNTLKNFSDGYEGHNEQK